MKTHLLIVCLLVISWGSWGQQSTNTVTYRLTYEAPTATYTVWVVPDYATPNANNTSNTERGATAQVTIAVPQAFVISQITDQKGSWEKAPLKLGPGQAGQDWSGYNLPASTNYYVIGKSAEETDYGTFVAGSPIALFSFRGNGCLGEVRIIQPTETFITAADNLYSLNAANSFYSRSGQPAGGNQNPLEQFRAVSGTAANCTVTVIATPDYLSTPKGTSVQGTILNNDTNAGTVASTTNSTLTLFQTPTNGTVVMNSDGTVTYTPNPTFTGTDCFAYTLCDKTLTTACDTARVCVQVTDVPAKAIYPFDDNNVTWVNTAVSGNVLTNDFLNTGTSPLRVTPTPVQLPSHGSVVLNADGSYLYTPTSNFTGTDTFTYQVCEASSPTICQVAVVSIEVRSPSSAINAPPIAVSDRYGLKTGSSLSGNVLNNDQDPDAGQSLSVSLTSQPSHGSVVLNPNGTFTYTPQTGYVGIDRWTYQTCDNGVPPLCDEAVVEMVVYGSADVSNPPPVGNDDVFIRVGTQSVTGNVLLNDGSPTNSPLTVTTSPLTAPTQGSVTLLADGSFTYIPSATYNGLDSFVYQVCDAHVPKGCSQATVYILSGSASMLAPDLQISKVVDKSRASLNETLTYTITVKNVGKASATNIVIKDELATSLQALSALATKGSWTAPNWTIPSLAVGDSAVLTLQVKIVGEGITTNVARVESLDQLDSNANNNESATCVSVPIVLCQGQSLRLSVPTSYLDVKWYKNGVLVGSGSTWQVTEAGLYTTTASNNTCPAQGCCPIEVLTQVCCPNVICLPMEVRKVK